VRDKLLQIPASDPGNIVGYEYETEERPLVLQEVWEFQREIPVREVVTRCNFLLAGNIGFMINYPESKPSQSGGNQWQWVVSDVKAIRKEQDMPPIEAVARADDRLFLSPGGPSSNGFSSWQEMGNWYLNLTSGRRDASAEIRQQAATLSASAHTPHRKNESAGPVCSARHSLRRN